MDTKFDDIARMIGSVLEMAGILAIVIGVVMASVKLLVRSIRRDTAFRFHEYRTQIGRAILLGLELLVAADIIGTVAVEPSFHSLGILAVIIVVRTFLSFALQVEITGRWPWQRASAPVSRSDRAGREGGRGPSR